MRVLVISSYPPRHCGIGAYARVQVERLRAEGHEVRVISPPDGDGEMRVPFLGGRPFREAARRGRRADRIVVHFQPALYYRPRAPLSKIATSLSLLWLAARRRQTEILVHEADTPKRWRPDYLLLAAALRAAPRLLFHTERERRQLERAYGVRVRGALVPHTDGVAVAPPPSRAEARRLVGIPPDEPLLVCPGFLHPGKGFDRALEAFPGTGLLRIVGSVKDPLPENLDHAEQLRARAARIPGAEVVDRFVDDAEFDAWIAAADAVVLPYRHSWSSGVLARAQAIGTPAIVAAAGGLEEQASPRDTVVRDDRELAAAMAAVARLREAAQ